MSSTQYNAKYVYASDGNAIAPEYQQELTATRVAYNPSNPYKYTFTGTVEGKDAARQQAIVDTICYMGWMSLKDSDHNGSGINAMATKRIQREAAETRKAAEALLNAGTITVIGEWSNGIRVGAGPAFVHIDHSAETKIALDTYEKNQSKAKTWAETKREANARERARKAKTMPTRKEQAAARDAQYATAQAENDASWGKALDEEQAAEVVTLAAIVTERYFQGIRWFAVMLNGEEIAVYPNRPDAQRRADALNDTYAPIIDFTAAEYSSMTYEVNNGPYCRMDKHYGDAYYALPQADDCSPMRYTDGASCPITIAWPNAVGFVAGPDIVTTYYTGDGEGMSCAVALTTSKPRYRVPLAVMRAACGLPPIETIAEKWAPFVERPDIGITYETLEQDQRDFEASQVADAAIAAITGEEYSAPAFVAPAYVAPTFVAPAMPAPTPIRPAEHYTPRVGDTVSILYRHENGTTTTRTVDVQRVGPALFRGFDRTYKRVRNFEYQHIASITLVGKEAVA